MVRSFSATFTMAKRSISLGDLKVLGVGYACFLKELELVFGCGAFFGSSMLAVAH